MFVWLHVVVLGVCFHVARLFASLFVAVWWYVLHVCMFGCLVG